MMSQQYPNGPPPAPQQHFQPASHQQVAQVLDILQQKNSTPKTTSPTFVEFNPANQTPLVASVATPIEGLDPPNDEDERSKLHCAVYGKALKVWVVGKLVTENVGRIILCPPGEISSSTSRSKSLAFAKKEKIPKGDAWFSGADIAACLNYQLTMFEYLSMKKGEDSELDSEQNEEAQLQRKAEEKEEEQAVEEIRSFMALLLDAYLKFKEDVVDVALQKIPEHSQSLAARWLLWHIRIVLYSGQKVEYGKVNALGKITEVLEFGRFFAVRDCLYFVNMEQVPELPKVFDTKREPSRIDFHRDWLIRQYQPGSVFFTYDITVVPRKT
jgi:hypothetical protein